MGYKELDTPVRDLLHQGTVIPAHPLALDKHLKIDEQRQRGLTRYYLSCGVGGLAVGVHTTQFEIRKPEFNYLGDVLRIAAEEMDAQPGGRPLIRVAGICGATTQALKEAELALQHNYHLGLVSLAGLNTWTDTQLIKHVEAITALIPVFGFYLQPAVGGRVLSYEFWKDFAQLPGVHAIKVAAFSRYQTLDVFRAVCQSPRKDKIALYTGNDDNIIADLLTTYRFMVNGQPVEKKFVGGLLGHWAVWTKRAVELFNEIRQVDPGNGLAVFDLLTKGIAVTDMNAVIFDARNAFRGCIAGIHEVLRRQGLLEGTWCLNPAEKLSPGQGEEIERLYREYSSLTDDDYVKQFIQRDKAAGSPGNK